jgi:cyclophilin family peptidyl-prolyl cis-trans isomerase
MSKFKLTSNIFLIASLVASFSCSGQTSSTATYKQYKASPPMTIDMNKNYTATIQTAKGNIVIALNPKDAPIAVNNFIFLARDGFYNNTTFFYVIPGFIAQAGDPTGTGTGGPGYMFVDEKNSQTHATGVVSMANRGQPNTNGSQFFITYSPQHSLDGLHTIFGRVVEGMNIVAKLTPRNPKQDARYSGDIIKSITIAETN